MAAQHFLERGFQDIAWFNFGNHWNETERIPSFRRTIEAASSRYHEIPYYQCFKAGSPPSLGENRHAHRWLVKALRALPKPIGIAVTSDDVATRVFHACDNAKINVPEQVAVLGCDNDPMICDYAPVPLSSVDNDWDGIGYTGARLLDQLMAGKPAPRQPILIPPKGVVTRRSTNVLAVPDPRLARAVRFIWEHYPEPIGTPDVAAAAGLNRRKLERDFQRHLGRSIRDEIVEMRIGRARKLLLETELKAYQVGEQCGFGTNNVHFSRTFRRLVGTTTSKYRRQHSKSDKRQ
jgi:LacI family transcriptional regulator